MSSDPLPELRLKQLFQEMLYCPAIKMPVEALCGCDSFDLYLSID
jgi:hypothetical protein